MKREYNSPEYLYTLFDCRVLSPVFDFDDYTYPEIKSLPLDYICRSAHRPAVYIDEMEAA